MGSMENVSRTRREDHKSELPPGFRFHPTDEELIIHYLTKKVADSCFCAIAIAEADLNKCEPWDLPGLAKMGETEWYYFCVRDRKYPTGLRTNRATDAGYWKATGKDKEIVMENALIGMRKTLVFYKGRAPKGEKTNWVMHEYRLEGNNKHSQYNLTKPAKSEWVICRVFEKGPCGKKMHIPNFVRFNNFNSFGKEPIPSSPAASLLPPLMDSSPYNNSETRTTRAAGELSQKTQDDIVDSSRETFTLDFSSSSTPAVSNQSPQVAHQIVGNSQYSDCFQPQEESMLRMMVMENHGSSAKQNQKAEFSRERENFDADISSVIYNNDMFQRWFGNQEHSSASAGPVDIDCLWNY